MSAYRDQPMQCPRCGKQLVQYESRDKWRCKECRGALVGLEQLEVEIGPYARDVLEGESDPNRPALHPCPVCAFPMTPFTIPAEVPVELDRCTEHRLAWFDGGEIGKVRASIPAESDEPLLTNTLGFLLQLREEVRATAAGERDEIPPAEPLEIKPGEWEQRTVCPDGACTGVIGSNGTCSVCGRSASASA